MCSPFRSTYVREISTEDLVKSYPVRAALESVAAREAATTIDDETLTQLEEHIAAMRRAAEVNDHRAHVDADFAFHHTIIKAAGNDMLEHVWQSMRLATTTLVTHAMIQMTHRSMGEIGERHVAVLEALRSRDPLVAEAAMRRHIEEPGEWIREAVRKDELKARETARPPRRPSLRLNEPPPSDGFCKTSLLRVESPIHQTAASASSVQLARPIDAGSSRDSRSETTQPRPAE